MGVGEGGGGGPQDCYTHRARPGRFFIHLPKYFRYIVDL